MIDKNGKVGSRDILVNVIGCQICDVGDGSGPYGPELYLYLDNDTRLTFFIQEGFRYNDIPDYVVEKMPTIQ